MWTTKLIQYVLHRFWVWIQVYSFSSDVNFKWLLGLIQDRWSQANRLEIITVCLAKSRYIYDQSKAALYINLHIITQSITWKHWTLAGLESSVFILITFRTTSDIFTQNKDNASPTMRMFSMNKTRYKCHVILGNQSEVKYVTFPVFYLIEVFIWRGTFCWKPHLNRTSGSKVMSN